MRVGIHPPPTGKTDKVSGVVSLIPAVTETASRYRL